MRVMAMRVIKSVMISSILFVLILSGLAGINPAGADDMTRSANGIKAELKIDASKSMVDLYIADSETSWAITGAKVIASITDPKGRRDEKNLIAMKMGEAVSYMNTVDMSQKGRYIFDITAEAGKRNAKFHFAYEIK